MMLIKGLGTASRVDFLSLLLLVTGLSTAHAFFVPATTTASTPRNGFFPKYYNQQHQHQHDYSVTILWNAKIPTEIDVLTSGLASMSRLMKGVTVDEDNIIIPINDDTLPRLVQLYDVENSSECRIVRERITELDLVVELVIPATPTSRVFQQQQQDSTLFPYSLPKGTKIPRLVVETDKKQTMILQGSDEILLFLEQNFTKKQQQQQDALQSNKLFQTISSTVANTLRSNRGKMTISTTNTSSNIDSSSRRHYPMIKPLVLYSYEGNQFCRLVREVLTELDIIYELKSAGKKSKRREELRQLSGGVEQCPFLIDPNTNISLLESVDIVKYLYKTYGGYDIDE